MRARSHPTSLLVVAFGLVVVLTSVPGDAARADDVLAGVFVRADTDSTTVISPKAELTTGLIDDATTLSLGYAADIWTSASIDIRTAATRPVSEQRDELVAGVIREMTDVTVRGGYRFSHEADYISHGGTLGIIQRLAQGAATLETGLAAAFDQVGRSGDEAFSRGLSTIGFRLALTQVLDPETVIQGAYELMRRDGYQASPYRFVGIGGDGLCNGTAQFCVPESHPSVRWRNAWVVRARRSLGEHWSTGVDYRFYLDDWGVSSHTASLQLSWLPDEDSMVIARYRFYWQGESDFYQPVYGDPEVRHRYVTRDRELSPMSTHRVVLAYERAFELTAAGPTVTATMNVG
ncbi:MAG: DUF3570 domain-containing protein, partial [Deltaproteobacteria bacterium]|nr:DUF3570 domain-containing protein [Deltaproteobacteria bacterium]